MVSRSLLAIAAVVATVTSATAADIVSSSAPYAGVTYTVYLDAAIPARIHVLEVDLSSGEITLQATTEPQRGKTVSEYSAESGAQMTVNGDYFSPVDFAPDGLAMGDATVWGNTSDDAVSGFVRFDRNGDRSHVTISPPASVVPVAELAVGTQGVIGGRPMIVVGGVAATSFDCADAIAMPCVRAPRTAVGVSQDGNTMWVVVVDGWQAGSLGMTASELGSFMDGLGVHAALLLDGGGSSAMHIAAEGGVVSSPSDGVERVVSNHRGVRFGTLPPGQLVGFIRERDIFDDTKNIAGATVLLDDGDIAITAADALYNFSSVTPRYACATASAPGYHTETRCKQVVSSEITYNSIALFPNSDFVDAGPGARDAGGSDAGIPLPDARVAGDGGAGNGDAGNDLGGDGCSCETTGSAGSLVWMLMLIPLFPTRRSSR